MGSRRLKSVTILPINDEMRISYDRYSWMIQKKMTSKKKEVSWESFQWYPRLSQAISAVLDIKLSEHDALTLETLRQEYDMIQRVLMAYIDASCVEDIAMREVARVGSDG